MYFFASFFSEYLLSTIGFCDLLVTACVMSASTSLVSDVVTDHEAQLVSLHSSYPFQSPTSAATDTSEQLSNERTLLLNNGNEDQYLSTM